MNLIDYLKKLLKDQTFLYRITYTSTQFRYRHHDKDKFKLAMELDYHLNNIRQDIARLQIAIELVSDLEFLYTRLQHTRLDDIFLTDSFSVSKDDHEALMLEGCEK
ncbi:MAG: hypothetical protein OXC46_00175 [Thaumarchaeota archaeon]|nr:hypothetical protein [Nitrososphaerota archaeon]